MNRLFLTAVSATAMIFAAGSFATAQDRKAQDSTSQSDKVQGENSNTSMKDKSTEQKKSMQQDGMTSSDSSKGTIKPSKGNNASRYKSYSSNESAVDKTPIAGGYRAEELIGADVTNAAGEEIGEIEDLVVDANNKVEKAILEVGGFLGIGSRTVAVDISDLKRGRNGEGFVSDMSKAHVEQLPTYRKDKDNWIFDNKM